MDRAATLSAGQAPDRLRAEDLRVPGLEPVTLSLAAGECVSLTGPSGSGKSRLLRALADLDEAAGRVTLDGVERAGIRGPQWRRRVMLVPAESHWWADSVIAHFPERPADDCLSALGLSPALLERDPADVSSGERQRLSLLRAVVRGPRVLLLDEPTANLDGASVERVEHWLLGLRAGGVALLWVTHDPDQVARVADRTLRIVDGSLCEAVA